MFLGCSLPRCLTWRAVRLAFALPAVLLALSCTKVPDLPTRVGMILWPGYEPIVMAKDKGYLAGHEYRLVPFTSASEVLATFRNGDIEVAAITLDEFLLLHRDVPDACVIAVLDVSHGADVILGKPGIAELSQLKGKRVAFEMTALGAYMITRALETAGMSAADIHPLRVDVDRGEEAYHNGEADAIVTFEPTATRLRALGAVPLFDSSQIPGEIVDVLVARRAMIDEHEDNLVSLLGGWFREMADIKRDPDESHRILGAQMELSADESAAAYGKLILGDEAKNAELLRGTPPPLEATANRLMETMVKHQLVAGEISPGDLIDLRPLDSYMRTRTP